MAGGSNLTSTRLWIHLARARVACVTGNVIDPLGYHAAGCPEVINFEGNVCHQRSLSSMGVRNVAVDAANAQLPV